MPAGMSIEYEATGNFILTLMNTSLDWACYEVWALISCTGNLNDYAIAPFKLVWRFANDGTVYAVVRTDLWPDIQAADFVSWFCDGDMCCYYCKVPWISARYCLEARSQHDLIACIVGNDPYSASWAQLTTFVRLHLGRDREEDLVSLVL